MSEEAQRLGDMKIGYWWVMVIVFIATFVASAVWVRIGRNDVNSTIRGCIAADVDLCTCSDLSSAVNVCGGDENE